MPQRTSLGYLCDENGDTMDSAVRVGIFNLFSALEEYMTRLYVQPNGWMLRCPDQEPSNNPWNVTRDQMMVFAAGLWAIGEFKLARRILYATLRRFCFSQSFQRDKVGSWKYPWPHSFHKDSNPKSEIVTKKFDFADFLWIHQIGHLILCGRCYLLYPISWIGYFFLYLSIYFNSEKLDAEQNQIISMVVVAGPWWIRRYKKHNPSWALQCEYYWKVRRNQAEYSDMILKVLGAI